MDNYPNPEYSGANFFKDTDTILKSKFYDIAGPIRDFCPAMALLTVKIINPPHGLEVADFSQIPLCG